MIPGKVVGISRNGEATFTATGKRNEDCEMNVETSFDAASITKIIATTAILMRLRDENQVMLDDKVAAYLPLWASKEKRDLL